MARIAQSGRRGGRELPAPTTAHGRRPEVAGYRIGTPLGFGARGPVWGATAADGRACAVAVLPLRDGERGAAQLRRLSSLVGADHPNLAGVLDVVATAGGCAVVSERVDGPTLATVRSSRPALDLGEAAWVLEKAAAALVHLHARGVVHGDVSPANVILAPGRGPVVVDLVGEVGFEEGTAGFRPPERRQGAAAGAAGDVWSLATTVAWMLAPGDRARATAHLAAALADDPAGRCDAVALVGLGSSLAEPRAVDVPGAARLAHGSLRAHAALEQTRLAARGRPRGRRRSPGRGPTKARLRSRHAEVGRGSVAVLVGILVAVTVGLVAFPGGTWVGQVGTGASLPVPAVAPTVDESGPVPGAVTPTDGEASLAAAVIGLVRERDRALEARDRAALERLTVPGSAAAGEAVGLLASLEAAGTAVAGLRTVVEDVAVLDLGQNGARVAVVTTQAPHARSVPGQPGSVAVPRQPTRCTVLVLDVTDERWRVREATACPAEIS